MSKSISDANNRSKDEREAAKKAVVLGANKKRGLSLVFTLIVCICAAALTGFFLLTRSGGSEESPSVIASTDKVTYPAEVFQDGKAHYYQLKTEDGKAIKFFILKSADGVIRSAFDACDVCWKAGLGYYQDGDFMVCRNCGQRFASVKVNEVKGGCNPAPLERELAGGQVVIKIKDILDGAPYFGISRRS